MLVIYKILRKTEWEVAKKAARLDGSPADLADGYIHFSTHAQLEGTVARHFAGEEGLVVLAVDTEKLGPSLRWEASRGGLLFPHLYAALQLDQIEWAGSLSMSDDGAHIIPFDAGN